MNKKALVLGILAVCLSISIGIGFSYAFWMQSLEQDDMNVFQSGCFQIELTDENNAINLQNQFPITDEDGKKLTPYSFTITNTCTIYASYSVNLEKIDGSDMGDEYIKVMLNNYEPTLYSKYDTNTNLTEGAIESKTLTTGGLNPNSSVTYELRIWLDENGTTDTVTNKTFNSRIVVSAVATEKPPTGAEYIESLLANNPNSMKNDDPDKNVRYIGANPNNYVEFNGELWRIIGEFDHMWECPDDDTEVTIETYTSKCQSTKLLKIIRKDSIGDLAWDTNNKSDWSNASLQKLLNNGDYWQRQGNYLTIGLTPEAKEMIATTMWNLGGTSTQQSLDNVYSTERGARVHPGNPEKWIGKVGLMYPSDFGYATGGGSMGRSACFAKEMYNWNNNGYITDCTGSDWLYNGENEWTLSSNYEDREYPFAVSRVGFVSTYEAIPPFMVNPVVYLKSDVNIIHDVDHDGSLEKPYELSF